MKSLTDRGVGIPFIPRRLKEVIELSDRVSVLPIGLFVLEDATANLTTEKLVEAMLHADFSAPV